MSLLDSGPGYEDCIVYPEIETTSTDGNPKTRPSDTGIPARARFQIQGQSGTSSRRQEQDNEGFESEKVYKVRFPRSSQFSTSPMGAQSEIEWRGARWAVFGDPALYNASRGTAHTTYTIKRY